MLNALNKNTSGRMRSASHIYESLLSIEKYNIDVGPKQNVLRTMITVSCDIIIHVMVDIQVICLLHLIFPFFSSTKRKNLSSVNEKCASCSAWRYKYIRLQTAFTFQNLI